MKKDSRKRKLFKAILLALLIILGVLGYYQWLYLPKVVNKGYVVPQTTFTQHKHVVTSIRFAAQDSIMVSSSVDSTIKIWNALTGAVIRRWKQPSGIAYMDVSADGSYIATGGYDSKVRLWRIEDGALLQEFSGHKGTVWTVAFNNDATKIASAGDDAVIRVWDIGTRKLYRELKGHKRIVWSVKFSPDGTHLASGSFDYSWKLWRLLDGVAVWDNKEHTETVVDLAFSLDGSMIATTSDDKSIRIWDVKRYRLKRMMEVPEHVQAVAFSPDGRRIIAGGRDKTMIGEFLQNFLGDWHANPGVSARLFDVKTGELLHCFTSHSNDVLDVAYSPSGRFVATASADQTVEVWKVIK